MTDLAGAPRASFTSTEQVAMTQSVYLSAPGSSPIAFTFKVLNPSGQQVFLQQGNSAPSASPGEASARIAGIPISRFYSVPGAYALVAEATVDNEPPVAQRVAFTITSPILTLLYPPDGVRGLEDRPLVLHWSSSGASRYRIQVSDDGSFYRTLFAGDSAGNDPTFAYPDNPPDSRQRLVGGQVYYWRVQALDANGNPVARSGTYSFSLKGSAVGGLTRDLAVTALDVVSAGAPAEAGAIPFRVVVRNQGGTAETNANLRFTVGGVGPPGSPFRLPPLSPGEEHALTLPARVPTDQENALAVACVDLFDDSVLNNCKTLLVASPRPRPLAPGTTEETPLTPGTTAQPELGVPGAGEARAQAAAAWDALKARADPQVQEALQGYHADEVSGEGLSAAEARQLLDDIKKGKAKILEMRVE